MLTIAYLGPEKTNTHLAAMARFGTRARYDHAPTVDEVFERVERRQAKYGVVPIENSLEGAVTHTLDRYVDFVDTPAKIQGEIERPIEHQLITHPGVTHMEIRAVYSHPQALAQSRSWLTQYLPRAVRRETNSTADAIWYVLNDKNARSRAAIGSKALAKEHRLHAEPMSTGRENKTRFLIIGMDEAKKGRKNKTSILFICKDKPGALHDALVPFKNQRINLTKIESRPSKRKAWEYLFFIDIAGHESEPRVGRALKALKRSTSLLRVLGSYPVAR
jgi:chorismate mutase/prephenate dehydratase